MIFIKKRIRVCVLFILLALSNGCNKPPEYFNELKESDLLIHPQKENTINKDNIYQENTLPEEKITN